MLVIWAGLAFYNRESSFWGKDLAGHPDESAHFTTGVMMGEFLRTPKAWVYPVAFASDFYAHYPKVAIGHWPPMFYVVEAAWFGVFGESVAAARTLVLLIGTLLMLATAAWIALESNWILGTTAFVFLSAVPIVGVSVSYVLADGLVALLCLAAMFVWSRFVDQGRARDASLFVVLAAMAILTKGNAWVLLMAACLSPALARNLRCYLRPSFWIAILSTIALAAPFYWIAQKLQSAYPIDNITNSANVSVLWLRVQALIGLTNTLPTPAWLFVGLGLILGWKTLNRGRWAVAVSFFVSLVAFLGLTGLSFEGRVLLPALPFLTILAVGGILFAMQLNRLWRNAILIVFASLLFLPKIEFWPHVRSGYGELASLIPVRQTGLALLIASDSIGEGATVVDRLIKDPSRKDVVLRGTKFLSQQDANGFDYKELYPEDAALLSELRRVPVHYVVVDEWSSRSSTVRLRRVATNHFQLLATRYIDGKRVDLFEDPTAAGRSIENLKFSLGPWHGDRTVEYRR